jgi:hypothetical protein
MAASRLDRPLRTASAVIETIVVRADEALAIATTIGNDARDAFRICRLELAQGEPTHPPQGDRATAREREASKIGGEPAARRATRRIALATSGGALRTACVDAHRSFVHTPPPEPCFDVYSVRVAMTM